MAYMPIAGGTDVEYMGVSDDDKPENPTLYSLALELDTGDLYYFDGEDWALFGDGKKGDTK